MKTMRKGAIVEYCGKDANNYPWGKYFEVYHKEGDFLRLISLKMPEFGVVAVIPCNECKLVNK